MKEPEFQCNLRIFFDNDFNVNEITQKLRITPHIAKRFSESGYTRKANIKQPGSWWYFFPSQKDYKPSWSVQDILREFFRPFSKEKVNELSKIIQANNGKVSLSINIYFKHGKLPEMCLDGEVMQIIHDLNADIYINMNEDNEDENEQ